MVTPEDYLRQFRLQITQPRIAVVDDLMTHHVHATAVEIYERLSVRDSSISRASVFNVLNTLVEKGAVRSVQIEEGVTRYDIDTRLHAHFRCTKCGRIMDIPMTRRPSISKMAGWKIQQEDYMIQGICPECRNIRLTKK